MRRIAIVSMLVLSAGCGAGGGFPVYCGECKAIRALLAKPNKTADETSELDRLEKTRVEKVAARAAINSLGTDNPGDVGSHCDCPCHLHVR